MTQDKRFWNKVDTSAGADGCWYWTGYTNDAGYGIVTRNNVRIRAHRLAYSDQYGEIPEGFEIDHTCHNQSECVADSECLHRRCVNPAHLEAVTHRENVLRGKSPSAQRARQTHCMRGHEFTPENTLVKGGHRNCKECHRLEVLVTSRKAQGLEHLPLDERVKKNSCKYGHAYTDENTIRYVNPTTGKHQKFCRTCRQDRARRQCEARGDVYTPAGSPKPFCKNGHEMTDENTYIQTSRGRQSRSCKACRKAASKRQSDKAKQAKSE